MAASSLFWEVRVSRHKLITPWKGSVPRSSWIGRPGSPSPQLVGLFQLFLFFMVGSDFESSLTMEIIVESTISVSEVSNIIPAWRRTWALWALRPWGTLAFPAGGHLGQRS